MKHRFYEREQFPLHISGKSTGANWPTPTKAEAWQVFCSTLEELHHDYELKTHAFVLMDNHYHWLCTYENFDEDKGLFEWFHELCRMGFLHNFGTIAQVFESEPEVIQLDSIVAYRNAYRYIYQNPVKAGLCKRVQDYPFSSLRLLLGGGGTQIEFHDNMQVIDDPYRALSWLNGEMEYGKYGWEPNTVRGLLH